MWEYRYWFLALLAAFLGCGPKKAVHLPPPKPAVTGEAEVGMASWYGHPYHGRRTSNGEIYNMNDMTAAHLRLPFGTRVRVTNLSNGRSVEVRINDRGPFIKGRIIDLSHAAAKKIAMVGPGTTRVRVKVLAPPSTAYKSLQKPPAVAQQTHEIDSSTGLVRDVEFQGLGGGEPCSQTPYYGVQVGSFRNFENAERLHGRMIDRYDTVEIVEKPQMKGSLYRVIVGREPDFAAASVLLGRLRGDRLKGFVILLGATDERNCL